MGEIRLVAVEVTFEADDGADENVGEPRNEKAKDEIGQDVGDNERGEGGAGEVEEEEVEESAKEDAEEIEGEVFINPFEVEFEEFG